MSIKVKTPKVILAITEEDYGKVKVLYYLCPTCLSEVKNVSHVCKYCNEELKEFK